MNHRRIRITNNTQGQFYDHFFSGVISKAMAIYCTYPISTVRTRIQQNQFLDSTTSPKYKNIFDIVRKIIV